MAYSRLETAILWTLLYADVFNFPMTAREIHHFLLEMRVSLAEVEQKLLQLTQKQEQAPVLASKEITGVVYYGMFPRAEIVFANREYREQVSTTLWSKAQYYGQLLSY